MRAALRELSIVASGPNDPSGARVPLPAVSVPAFRDRDVAEAWGDQVFRVDHMIHRLRGAEKAPPQKASNP